MINLFANRLLPHFAEDTGADAPNAAAQKPTEPAEQQGDDGQKKTPDPQDDPEGPEKPSRERTFSRAELAKIVAEEREKAKQEGKSEAEKLANMNDSQKVEYENQQLKDRLAELEKNQTRTAMGKEAAKMLASAGLEADDDVLNFVVKDSAEDTKAAVDTFVSLVDAAATAKTRAALSGKAPKVNLNGNTKMTKDEIMKIKDPAKRQKAIAENIALFK